MPEFKEAKMHVPHGVFGGERHPIRAADAHQGVHRATTVDHDTHCESGELQEQDSTHFETTE